MKDNTNITHILSKYIRGVYSESDKLELDKWLKEHPQNQKLLDKLTRSELLKSELKDYNLFDTQGGWNSLQKKLLKEDRKGNVIYNGNFRRLLSVACVLCILFGLSFYFFQYKKQPTEKIRALSEGKILKDANGEILPATTGAIILTATGEQVELVDSFKIDAKGAIIGQNSTEIVNTSENIEGSYYELIVPKAKIINFTLFDGTRIWVNANSRLRIPTNIIHGERRVSLISGEAYFEVQKFQNMKFIVETSKGNVEVLGTKFNVNSYGNHFRTTLLEGSVKLSNDNEEKMLVPNSSAVLVENNFIVSKANLNADMAWVNNIFYFSNYSIQRIAKQIENWYGVKVQIGPEVAMLKSTYSGELRRDVPLTEVKKMLEFISGFDVEIVDGEYLNIDK